MAGEELMSLQSDVKEIYREIASVNLTLSLKPGPYEKLLCDLIMIQARLERTIEKVQSEGSSALK